MASAGARTYNGEGRDLNGVLGQSLPGQGVRGEAP